MSVPAAFGDISVLSLVLLACFAVFTSIIGGVSGYGSGALMPLVLVPLVGPEPVVPIVALASMFTNTSRVMAFSGALDKRAACIVLVTSIPTCMIGAYGYSLLTGRGALIVIGLMMIAGVPLRRMMRTRGYKVGDKGAGRGLGRLGISGRRHHRLGRDPAVVTDGGGA